MLRGPSANWDLINILVYGGPEATDIAHLLYKKDRIMKYKLITDGKSSTLSLHVDSGLKIFINILQVRSSL